MNNKITAIFIVAIFLMSFGVVLAADGDVIWKREYDGNGPDYAMGVATDSYNNVIVTGISEIGGRRSDYCTIKYQGVPPRSKSLPIDKFLKILKRNRCKNHPDAAANAQRCGKIAEFRAGEAY